MRGGGGECFISVAGVCNLTLIVVPRDPRHVPTLAVLPTYIHRGTYKYDAIKRCHPLVWGNMTHDDASVETGVGGQAKYDMMMVFCGNALQKHHNTLKSSTRRYPDCHILHILNR